MKRMRLHRVATGLSALVLTFGWVTTGNADVTTIGGCALSYEQCLSNWKEERLVFLKSEGGYLNLAGLFWLRDGTNTFGSGPGNDIVFPDQAAAAIGTFDLRNGAVKLTVNAEVEVRHMDTPIRSIVMAGDSVKEPVVVRNGTFAWSVIKRDNRFAVRLRDFDNPIMKNFPAIDYYPTSNSSRVSAVLHAYEKPRVISVDTVIEGLNYNPWSPGTVKFEIDGQVFELEAYDAGNELFFVFGDQTSGRGTYPAGRFLYAQKPGSDGVTELDFNTAHSPPCAYNEFATCPIASARNRIAIRIMAGERYDPTGH
jgi:uncharacterized protein (DUF1684 family)